MNGTNHTPTSPWLELEERLKTENVIMAGDLMKKDILYLITLGEKLQTGNRGSGTEDSVTAVPETSSSTGSSKVAKERYHLVVNERKGHGGFGVVYRVTKTHHVSKASLEICLKQARTLAWDSLLHENEIFNVLHDHPQDYIIRRDFMCKSINDVLLGLEYFDGRTLSDIITINSYKKWKIPHKDLVIILQQQTEAIDHLQKNGIFHCDIKPENIIYHRGRQLSKLIDFGLAVTRTGLDRKFKSQGGTTEYMGPETLVDSCLERGSDLYGLAATLHHLITLRCPWFSLQGVQAIRDEKIDRKDPNYEFLSKNRRARIRQCIKSEIIRYRGEAAEAAMAEQPAPPLAMAVQNELWAHEGTCDQAVKYIICLMLHHTPNDRPDCTDILSRLKSTVNPDIHVHREISIQSSNSNLSDTDQSSSTITSQPSHPVVLDYTDLQKSDPSNLAVEVQRSSNQVMPVVSEMMENVSIHDEPRFSQLMDHSSHMQQASERMSRMSGPRLSQLMSVSSAQGPNLSQLMGRSSQMQHPSENMAGRISFATTDMMSVPESGLQPAENEYQDDCSGFEYSEQLSSDLASHVEESSAYRWGRYNYAPDPNQPTADDPTGMTDYYANHREAEASNPPSDTSSYSKVQDVLADGGHEYANGDTESVGRPSYGPIPTVVDSVQPTDIPTVHPVSPEGGMIQSAGIQPVHPVSPEGGMIQSAGIQPVNPVSPEGVVSTTSPVSPEGGMIQSAGVPSYSPLSPEGTNAKVKSPAEVEDEDDEDL